jgi:hypothetical protein
MWAEEDETMRHWTLPQADLFKAAHEVPRSQRTTAVALLKALLIEAMFADTTKATIEDAAGNNAVEDTGSALKK